MTTFKISALLILTFSFAACVDPTPKPPIKTTPTPPPRNTQDAQFIEKLRVLKTKDPISDAQTTIRNGEKYFLCNVGRSRTVPGLTPEAYADAQQKCPTQCMDGVTDAIYGRNHAKYLQTAVGYSASWNQVMIKVCQ